EAGACALLRTPRPSSWYALHVLANAEFVVEEALIGYGIEACLPTWSAKPSGAIVCKRLLGRSSPATCSPLARETRRAARFCASPESSKCCPLTSTHNPSTPSRSRTCAAP